MVQIAKLQSCDSSNVTKAHDLTADKEGDLQHLALSGCAEIPSLKSQPGEMNLERNLVSPLSHYCPTDNAARQRTQLMRGRITRRRKIAPRPPTRP